MSPQKEAKTIAYYFIKKNEKDHRGLDNKKLQKLLYYSQAWNLVFHKEPLFSDKIEAWIHGPAIPQVWRMFRDFNFSVEYPEILDSDINLITAKEKKILDEVWRVYGKFDGNYLESLTHNEEPWLKARQGLEVFDASQNEIPQEEMRSYYSHKLSDLKKI